MINCTFEDGGKGNLRHVVVDGVVVNAARDAVLIVRRAPHLTDGGKFGLIGGFLDRDETTEQGMVRELKEETGYDGTVVKRLEIVDNPVRGNEDRQNVTFVFLVEAGKQTGEPDNESTEVTWFKLDDLPKPEEFAFDHYSILERALQTLKK